MRLSPIILLFAVSAHSQVRYHFGDNPQWSDTLFDDSSWPVASEDKFPMPPYSSDGMVWLRYRVTAPPDASPLAIRLARDKDVCSPGEVWVNGVHVGTQGRLPPEPVTTERCQSGVFDLPQGSVVPGETAVVAWRGWISPISRSALSGLESSPPTPFAVEIGSRGFMLARERNATDGAVLSALLDEFFFAFEVLVGLAVLLIWWRANGGAALFWFAIFVLAWSSTDILLFWPSLRQNGGSQILWWSIQCGFSLIVNTALFEFMGAALDVPRWSVRTMETIGIAWPILWFPSALLVAPSAVVAFLASTGLALFAMQCVGQTALALWAIVRSRDGRGGRETRGLALTLFCAGVVVLCSDVIFVVPGHLHIGDNEVATDNLSMLLVICAMCYLLLGRMWHDWRKKEELNAEFEAAREMQERLVPRAIAVPGFHIESAYHPARHVGGDFFRILPGANGSALVVMGDVSGKGLSAAMTVAAIAGALDNEFSRDPAEVLTHLNRALLARKNGGFVTCCAVCVELSGDATIANAGHLVPYAGGVELTVDAELPLGITEDAVYRETRIRLAPDQYLTFVSDGVVEAANVAGELFGFERTRAISGDEPENIAQAAREFGQNDDITVVTVRRQS